MKCQHDDSKICDMDCGLVCKHGYNRRGFMFIDQPPPIQKRNVIIAAALTALFCILLFAFGDYLPHAATGCHRLGDAMPLFGDCNAPR